MANINTTRDIALQRVQCFSRTHVYSARLIPFFNCHVLLSHFANSRKKMGSRKNPCPRWRKVAKLMKRRRVMQSKMARSRSYMNVC